MDSNDKPFLTLSSVEQKKELERIMNYVRRMYIQEITLGKVELVDISYNELSNGEVVFDVTLNCNKQMTHEFFRKTPLNSILKEPVLSDKLLAAYQACGYDTTNIVARKNEIANLPDSPNQIKLTQLYEDYKELYATSKALGIDGNQITDYVKFDDKNKVVLDENKINGLSSQEIKGNEYITTYHTMNDILKKNYATYKIVKVLNGQSAVFGITPDGKMEQIKGLEFYNVNNMSLQKANGDLKNVGVVTAFRIKSNSEIDRDQVIGLYRDNGQIDGFYSRGATNSENLIGEKLPSTKTFTNYTSRIRSSLDTRENQDISGESRSAQARTNTGNIDRVQNISSEGSDEKDINSLAEDYSKVYSVDKEELLDNFEEIAEDKESRNLDDGQIMEQAKDQIIREENEIDKENDDENPEHALGTPWGNPDNK